MSDRISLFTDGREDSWADVSLREHRTPEAVAQAIHSSGPFKAYGNDPVVMLRFLEALEERGWPTAENFKIEVEGFPRMEHETLERCREVFSAGRPEESKA